jgi:hypothetical protein
MRSTIAADMTLERLCEGHEWIYLWTFTFAVPTGRNECAKAWHNFNRSLCNRGIELNCVRAFEENPGSNGLHIHFITPEFHHVNKIRPLAQRAGFGRIHVKRIPSEKRNYVLKYIRKACNVASLRGCKKWFAVGKCAHLWRTRCKDIIVDNGFTRAWAWLKLVHPKWLTMRHFERKMLTERVRFNAIVADYHPYDAFDFVRVDGVLKFLPCDCPF